MPDQLLTTPRLLLERLRAEHADEMVAVLDDARLHEFVGGEPLRASELRDRYQRVAALRTDEGCAIWPSWIVRRRADGVAIGTVHATVDGVEAHLGWVIGSAWQGQGFATEAACALIGWLEAKGITKIQAAISLHNAASAAVAVRAGLHSTSEEIDGERIWRKPARNIR